MIVLAQDQAVQATITTQEPQAEGYVSDHDCVVEDIQQRGNFEVHSMIPAQEHMSVFGQKLAESLAGKEMTSEPQDVSLGVDFSKQPEAQQITNQEASVNPEVVFADSATVVGSTLEVIAHQGVGVNLSRLEGFNERHKNQLSRKKKTPNVARQAAPTQRPMILQSEKSQNYVRAAMRSSRAMEEDGHDHINTSSSAVTKLGRALEINAHVPFNHPDLGPFKSVGGLWYFIGGDTQDESFRHAFGGACRSRGQNVKMREVAGFKVIIAEATWIKIRSDELLSKAMAACELPYRCYYLVGELGLPKSTPSSEWYMPILEEIARTLKAIYHDGKEDAFPNFDFLEPPPRATDRGHKRY